MVQIIKTNFHVKQVNSRAKSEIDTKIVKNIFWTI